MFDTENVFISVVVNYQTISKVHYTLLLQMFHSNMRFNRYIIDILNGFLIDDAVVKGRIL